MEARTSVDCIAFTSKSDALLSWSWGAIAQVWDPSTRAEKSLQHIEVECPQEASFSPGARLLACRAEEGVQVWDVTTGKQIVFLRLGEPGGENIVLNRLAFSPDGRLLAGVGYLGRTLVWEVSSGKLLWEQGPITDTHRSAVVWSSDGQMLAVGTSSGFIRLFEAAQGRQVGQIGQNLAAVRSIAFGREDRILASSSRDLDGTFRLWEMPSGRELPRLARHEGSVHELLFSPDGEFLASGDSQGVVRVWDARRFEPVNENKPHTQNVSALAFSPAGGLIASGSWDGTVEISPVK